jgi:hypothetical protein
MSPAIPALLIALAAGTAHADRFGAGAAGFSRALRDTDTGLPRLLHGGAPPVPGASRAPALAARRLLERHLAELAPGTRAGDFALLVDREAHGTRTVAFAQQVAGVPVLGARISFRFQGDRLVAISSTAVPGVALRPPARSGLVILPLRRRGAVEPRVAIVASRGTGFTRETVWLDAATGELLARRPLFRHASGTVRYDTPVRWPGGERAAYPAAL